MANTSKEFENTNKKVIVIKSNDFFSLKKINSQQRENIEDLRRNLTPSNVSFISRVHNASNSFYSPIYPQSNVGSQQSVFKGLSSKNVSKQEVGSASIKKYKRKIPVIEERLENTGCANFGILSNTKGVAVGNQLENNAEADSIIMNDNLNEEKVIELVNEKYGDALEAEISFFQKQKSLTTPLYVDTTLKVLQDITPVLDPTSKISTDVYRYKLKEEQFLEEIDKEQTTNEADKWQTVLSLDSPEDDYKLFTREELKKLPEKIFESPKPLIKKEEIPLIKEEGLKEETASFLPDASKFLLMTVSTDSYAPSNVKEIETNEAKVDIKKTETNHGKTIWEELTDINLLITQLQTTNFQEKALDFDCSKNKKAVVMAKEDTLILQEIDKFISESRVQNRKYVSPKVEALVCSSENENKIANNDIPSHMEKDHTNAESCKATVEILENYLRESNKYVEDNVELVSSASEVENISNINSNVTESSIFDVTTTFEGLEKSVEAKEIVLQNGAENENDLDKFEDIKVEKFNDAFEEPLLIQNESEKSAEVETLQFENNTTCQSKENVEAIEIIVDLKDIVTLNENQTQHFSSVEQDNSSECTVLVVKENGFLEKVDVSNNPQNVEPLPSDHIRTYSKENVRTYSKKKDVRASEQSSSIREDVNKEQILSMLEKAKGIQYNLNDGTVEKEKLKNFSTSLKEHVKILKETFEKLESFTESAVSKLDVNSNTDLSALNHDLNFVKCIVEKTFVKEKKLKCKVISISKKNTKTSPMKSKPAAKKNVKKVATKTSAKLLRKTMYRVNRLLTTLEKNRTLFLNTKRKTFVSKLREVAKGDFGNKKVYGAEPRPTDTSDVETNCEKKDLEEENVTSNTEDSSNISNKSLAVVLERPNHTVVKLDTEKININEIIGVPYQQKPYKNFEQEGILTVSGEFHPSLSSSSSISEESETNTVLDESANESDSDCVEIELLPRTKEKEEDFKVKEEYAPGYSLRSRKTTVDYGLKYPMASSKDLTINKPIKRGLRYEVNYSNVIPLTKHDRNFDYVLRNDNKPCIILYNKTKERNNSIFKIHDNESEKLIPARRRIKKKNKSHGCHVPVRYETRSRTFESRKGSSPPSARVLRSRKI